jgi:purine-nucleoside phosphorylase
MSNFAALAQAARASPPEAALVLGSGLAPVAQRVLPSCQVGFADVPGLPPATVAGHRGRVLLGDWCGRRVLIFEGRAHFYEGHAWREVTVAVRVAASLGAGVLLLTCAAGGIRDDLGPGSLLAIRDHIEWTRPFCWREPGPGGLGPLRVPPYAPRLLGLLGEAAVAAGVGLAGGIYATVSGPCYDTPAEIRALRAWGADAVGMSTAREAQAAADAGMECAAVACITNRAAGLSGAPLDHGEVLANASRQSETLASLLEELLRRL